MGRDTASDEIRLDNGKEAAEGGGQVEKTKDGSSREKTRHDGDTTSTGARGEGDNLQSTTNKHGAFGSRGEKKKKRASSSKDSSKDDRKKSSSNENRNINGKNDSRSAATTMTRKTSNRSAAEIVAENGESPKEEDGEGKEKQNKKKQRTSSSNRKGSTRRDNKNDNNKNIKNGSDNDIEKNDKKSDKRVAGSKPGAVEETSTHAIHEKDVGDYKYVSTHAVRDKDVNEDNGVNEVVGATQNAVQNPDDKEKKNNIKKTFRASHVPVSPLSTNGGTQGAVAAPSEQRSDSADGDRSKISSSQSKTATRRTFSPSSPLTTTSRHLKNSKGSDNSSDSTVSSPAAITADDDDDGDDDDDVESEHPAPTTATTSVSFLGADDLVTAIAPTKHPDGTDPTPDSSVVQNDTIDSDPQTELAPPNTGDREEEASIILQAVVSYIPW